MLNKESCPGRTRCSSPRCPYIFADRAEAWGFPSWEGCCLFLHSERLVIPSLVSPSFNDPHLSVLNPSQIKCNACVSTNPAARFCSPLPPLLRISHGAHLWLAFQNLSSLENSRCSPVSFQPQPPHKCVCPSKWVKSSARAGRACSKEKAG